MLPEHRSCHTDRSKIKGGCQGEKIRSRRHSRLAGQHSMAGTASVLSGQIGSQVNRRKSLAVPFPVSFFAWMIVSTLTNCLVKFQALFYRIVGDCNAFPILRHRLGAAHRLLMADAASKAGSVPWEIRFKHTVRVWAQWQRGCEVLSKRLSTIFSPAY